MARVRRPGVLSLALLAAWAGTLPAFAQTLPEEREQVTNPTDSRLFRPLIDGDPKNPQRFVKPQYGYKPAFGAGTSGFDSSNKRPKQKAERAARARAEIETKTAPPLVAPVPDRSVAPVFQPPEASVARTRAQARSAGAPEITGMVPRPVRKPVVELEDPYAPVGVNVGAFTLRPAIEVYVGRDSNPARANQNIQSSGTQKAAAELNIKSNWSRHEFTADLKGDYTWYTDTENFNKPNVDWNSKTRIDITSQTRAEIENRFKLLADSPSDPNLPQGIAKPPLYWIGGATFGLAHRFNRLELSAKGLIDRTEYDTAELNNGDTLDLKDRNYDQHGGQFRASYETWPGIKPFVEVGFDKRIHDRQFDASGFERDSDGRNIKVGSTFELTRYLTGEISFGRLHREYVDARVPNLSAPTLDAALTYFATPLTTFKVDIKTTVDESILPGVSGALNHSYNFQIDHSFRRWLIFTGKLGYTTSDYEGAEPARFDKTWLASAALTYKMTREIHLKAEYRREWLDSNVVGADYKANIFMFGLRLQR